MVHYLAGLIKDAERASEKNRPTALEKCFNAILALWQHRHELPNGARPFEELEPVLRGLESLDPSNPDNRYFAPARPPPGENESKVTRDWIALADGLDHSARVLISHCLANASAGAIDQSKEWVALAEKAGLSSREFAALKIIIGERDLDEASDPANEQRKVLVDRVGKLQAFIKLAGQVAADYGRQLKQNRPARKTRLPRKSRKVPRALVRPNRVVVELRKPRRKRAAKNV